MGFSVEMPEVLVLLDHGRFVDVVIGGDAILVREFGDLAHVFEIVAADIQIEENHVAVDVLLAQQVLEILPRGLDGLGQAGLQIPGVQREIENGGPASAKRSATSGRSRRPLVPI